MEKRLAFRFNSQFPPLSAPFFSTCVHLFLFNHPLSIRQAKITPSIIKIYLDLRPFLDRFWRSSSLQSPQLVSWGKYSGRLDCAPAGQLKSKKRSKVFLKTH